MVLATWVKMFSFMLVPVLFSQRAINSEHEAGSCEKIHSRGRSSLPCGQSRTLSLTVCLTRPPARHRLAPGTVHTEGKHTHPGNERTSSLVFVSDVTYLFQ